MIAKGQGGGDPLFGDKMVLSVFGRPASVFVGVAGITVGSLWAGAEQPVPPVVDGYCLACHNDQTRTAGISLEGLDREDVTKDPAVWEKVLRKVTSEEMPPPGAPSPEPSVRSDFVERLEGALDAAATADPHPGQSPLRRLNRAEYANAVRDLLALEVDVSPWLPVDDSGYGFDTIADVLSLTPTLLDRYMLAARRIGRLALGVAPTQPVTELFVRDRETAFRHAGHARASPDDLPVGAGRGVAIRYYAAQTGQYSLRATLTRGSSLTGYVHEEARIPLEGGMHTLSFSFPRESSRRESARPDAQDAVERRHPPLDVRVDGRRLRFVEMPRSSIAYGVHSISIEGPFDATGPGDTPSRRRIFTCYPDGNVEEGACAERILSDLARQAYRRPVGSREVAALMDVYRSGDASGGFERGIEHALRAVLVSPRFLFRIERDPEGLEKNSVYPIEAYELASRLSFFLWSSLPDEELLAAASRGQLHDSDELERQVRRMLADPRSRALVENFAGQWLELRKVSRIKPDTKLFPDFDVELRLAMRQETELFLDDILRNDRSILELLDSKRSFLNERLARHYGIEGVYGRPFREVRLDDPRRGGLLGHGSILAVTSYPNRTSVVIRGKWVLENLFGMPPPPPPPGIPELEESAPEGQHLSMRDLMALHSRNPACASCHVRMDPIGFALENFDAVGRWRDHDGTTAIDATGELPGGVKLDGPAGLRTVLVTRLREAFARTVVEKLQIYALGRGLEYYDGPTVRAIVRDAEESGYRLTDLVVGVARSMPFRMRRIPES